MPVLPLGRGSRRARGRSAGAGSNRGLRQARRREGPGCVADVDSVADDGAHLREPSAVGPRARGSGRVPREGHHRGEGPAPTPPRPKPAPPPYEPRGCQRGISASWYVYSPIRVKYPYIRGALVDFWREARAKYASPVAAWKSLVEEGEKRAPHPRAPRT